MRDYELPRVFVVDDEPIIAKALALILGRSGLAARFFVDPVEALRAAESAAPDLVISDVMMPQLSGVEFAIKMRGQCPKCRILLFSGQAGTADLLRQVREQGQPFDLLIKPVHPSDLLKAIRNESSLRTHYTVSAQAGQAC